MILVTIQDMPDHILKKIEENTGRKVITDKEDLSGPIPFSEIEILITYGRDVVSKNLDKLSSLKWIQILQTGVEKLPFEELIARDIAVTNIKGIYGDPMSEYAMSKILYFSREIDRFVEQKKEKRYDRTKLVDEIGGKKIGIFGTGLIGTEVAKKAQCFGMEVIGFNSSGRSVDGFDKIYSWDSKEEMLKVCDYIVLVLPLIEETKGFLSAKEFDIIKPTAVLVNIGRGPLINENDFIDAMKEKKLRGAALDVFDVEPLIETHPYWDLDNVIITPHLSGKTTSFFDRTSKIFLDNYKHYLNKSTCEYTVDLERRY